jgi:hypothetical protein
MPTIGGVTYEEMYDGSGLEQFDYTPGNFNVTATRCLKCAWTDRYTLINAAKNTVHPSILGCYATTFSIAPIGKPTGENTFTDARISLQYKTLPFDPTLVKEEVYEGSAQSLGTPSAAWRNADANGNPETDDSAANVHFDVNIFLSTTTYTVTLHNQATFNRSVADGLKNQVNSGSFNGWAAGTVLFLGYTATQKTTVGAGTIWEISYKFEHNPFDHRKEFSINQGKFVFVKTRNGDNYKYDSGNFGLLAIP